MFAGIVSWLLSKATGKFIGDIIQKLAGTDAGQARLHQIEAEAKIALKREDSVQLAAILATKVTLQQAKMNQPVFWIIIAVMMGPPALMLWGVTLYNFLWWQDGIWPQSWAIADFPPSIKPWVEKSIDWLYDPIGPITGVGSALLASFATGGRK